MSSIIKLGLLSIPFTTINFYNSKYSETSLHRFSPCCLKPVGLKNYCKSCNKELLGTELLKGFDEKHILTNQQAEQLKNSMENGIMEILSFKDITETTFYDLIPYVLKSALILPSISKGFRKQDFKTFYSLKNAMKELNKYAICKLTQRGTEHLIILANYKGDLIAFEMPFFSLFNNENINNLKQRVEIEKAGLNENEYLESAQQFINNFKGTTETNEIKESKKLLLKTFLEAGESGEKEVVVTKESNPFLL
jgi:non-homologous end joining protein Ku